MILITGAGGFIGSHLCDHLFSEGYSLKEFKGDFTRLTDVERNLRGVDTVIHLGALTYVPASFDTPWTYFRVNTLGTLNFLKCKRMYDRFIYFSTSHTYGNTGLSTDGIDEMRPLKESDCQIPRDPYSASKLAAENLVHIQGMRDNSFAYTVIRPFNNYGPGQDDKFLIPTLIRRALKGRMYIYGDSERDMLYVKDTVEAVRVILDNPKRTFQETFNVCSNQIYSVRELSRLVYQIVTGEALKDGPEIREINRPTDISHLHGDNSKLRRMLGWNPRYSIYEGLRVTVSWYKEHGGERYKQRR